MDARDTSALFALAGVFIVVVQGGLIGRWSKKKGDRWLALLGLGALTLGGGVLHPAVNSLITKSANKSEVGGMLGISAAFYSAANAVAPLFYGSLFQWLGAPRVTK